MEKNRNIELRSEKTRKIIGNIPSYFVRSGITFIAIILIGLIISSAFIPYPESIAVNTEIINNETSNNVKALSFVPYSYITQIHIGLPVQVELEGYSSHLCGTIKGKIIEMNKNVYKKDGENFFEITIELESLSDKKTFELKNGMAGVSYILLSNECILKHISNGVFN